MSTFLSQYWDNPRNLSQVIKNFSESSDRVEIIEKRKPYWSRVFSKTELIWTRDVFPENLKQESFQQRHILKKLDDMKSLGIFQKYHSMNEEKIEHTLKKGESILII